MLPRSVATLCVLLASCGRPPSVVGPGAPPDRDGGSPASLSATDILRRSEDAYEHCPSYRDEGVVLSEDLTPRRRRTKKPFKTWFVRPDKLRFEWYAMTPAAEWEPYVVIWTGGKAHVHWQAHRSEIGEKRLRLAMAGATGVSGGSAAIVPGLLLPDVLDSYVFDRLDGVERLADETVEGTRCHQIRGVARYGDHRVTVFIGQEDHLLRKVVEATTMSVEEQRESARQFERYMHRDGGVNEPEIADGGADAADGAGRAWKITGPMSWVTTTTYSPVCGVAIAPSQFRFAPPPR